MSLFSVDETSSLQKYKAILGKVDEMRKQRISLESQLRDLIHKDDITGVLVTTDRAEIKVNDLLILHCLFFIALCCRLRLNE